MTLRAQNAISWSPDTLFRVAAVLGISFTLAAGVQAGDILRGGAVAGSRPGSGAAASPKAARTEQVRANAQDALKRTTQAVQAVKAMQDAARSLAVKGPGSLILQTGRALPKVPNGLVPGGLQVAPGLPANPGKPVTGEGSALWQGALLPKQTQSDGRTRVTIEQLKPQALLTWQTFNVGKETTLTFNQGRGGGDKSKWIAVNKVNDPSGQPSQILGQIEAPGQVYIINRNGILFGGSSQINLSTLVASTLPINDNLLTRGLLNNPDAQFLFSALPLAAGANTPAFNPTISDTGFRVSAGAESYTLAEQVAVNASNAPVREPEFTFRAVDGGRTKLIAGTDYTLTVEAGTRKTTAIFTATGLQKVGEAKVSVDYTPVVVKAGDVVVQAGAKITSPVNAEGNGGRVMLVGANVRNEGTISTPAGQTILAAGLQLGVNAHDAADPSLRGLDVFVGAITAEGVQLPSTGTATNLGLIEAPRGNVTMAGKTVEQLNVIDSSTSTALNGRVDLLASYGATANPNFDDVGATGFGLPPFLFRQAGLVTLGVNSVTRILPELAGEDRAVGTRLTLPSQVNAQGQAIHFAAGSEIFAPNANVTLSAGNWVPFGTGTALKYTGGQIYFDPGATINVAGSVDILAPITQNFLSLQLRGSELANSPLQRTGLLRGPSITVDTRLAGTYNGTYWIGTPLGDVSGYLGIIERTVGELTVAGGTVSLNAGESVVMQPGSKIDVSGGWINFEGGLVQTTRVLSGGVLYDLSRATPDRVYDGIYTGTSTFTNAKYGLTETFAHPLALTGAHYEQSYLHGANAGTIAIAAPSQVLDGTLLGQAVQGPRQENSTTFIPPTPGSLALTFQAGELQTPYLLYSPTPPRIVFDAWATSPAAAAFALDGDGTPKPLRDERKKELFLSPDLLTENGFGSLTIDNSDGAIIVPADTALTSPLRGSITLRAANLEIDGSVTAPGGTLAFSVFNFSPSEAAVTPLKVPGGPGTPAANPERGIFSLGPAALLNTAGLITDYRAGAFGPADVPPLIDGGSITINAYTAHLAEGSVIDVSGGVSISALGKQTYGAGGSIVINAGRDPNITSILGGELVLGPLLKGYSGSKGGSLTVQAPLIQIGGPRPVLVPSKIGTDADRVYLIGDTEVGRDELLYLTPEFFNQGGFTSFTLTGLGKAIDAPANEFLTAINIAPDTVIKPVATSWMAVPGPGGGPVTLQPFLKPEGLRTPISLAFNTPGTQDLLTQPTRNILRGDFVMGAGALIDVEPRASVSIRGSTVAILGSIFAPAGSITISGANAFPSFDPAAETFKLALPTVNLGPHSVLSTAGRVLLSPGPYGRRIGSVLPGGTITVSGNIVAEAGALLDVSGASGIFDLPAASLAKNIPLADGENGSRAIPFNSGLTAPLRSLATVPTVVESDAGLIALRGGQELFTDATLRGFAGGPTARGGSLIISSGRFFDRDAATLPTPLDITLIVTQSGRSIPVGYYPEGQTAIGHLVPVAGGNANLGLGHFAADSFLQGGFDALTLSGIGGDVTGAVQFSGNVSIRARRSLSISDGGVIFADANVSLQAPYVALGTAFQAPLLPNQTAALSFPGPFYALPTYGTGSFTVRAALIDIGNLSLQNIGRATFIADGGDIRGNGTLDVAGAIELRAGQIYPTTASRFTIAAYDPNITVATSSTASNQVTLASAVLPPGFGVGSPLLGTKVTAIDGVTVTLEANANATIAANTPVTFDPGTGSVTITGSGDRPLPLSAGGKLSIYGSNINQGGTLRAPLGTINLGWDGTEASPVDYLSGAGIVAGRSVPITQQLTLSAGSVTSISAVDPLTGQELLIPYGLNANGISWIDPTGVDITAGGLPNKAVNLFALGLSMQAGSQIDVRGGGDLYAYRWVAGNGGSNDLLGSTSSVWNSGVSYTAGQLVSYQGATWSARRTSQGVTPSISLDWTLVPQSFAVLPGYQANYSPYAPFNNRVDPLNLIASDTGYGNAGLSVGDRIYLGASNGLSAGTYTLLPARYALLPGAMLVTPKAGAPMGTFLQPEGASLVSGYRFNDLNGQQLPPVQALRFEVAAGEVLRGRAQYDDYFATSFLKQSAQALGITVPRLPLDSGRVVFAGLNALRLDGEVLGRANSGGHDAQIDISSVADIFITGPGGSGPAGSVVLNAVKLSSFGAESLLVGGLRQTSPTGTTITVKTGNVTVDNAGAPLNGPEIILVAKTGLTLAAGAEIVQVGSTRGSNDGDAATLRIGDASIAGSGNGVLLRVSDVQVPLIRSGMTSLAAQAALANPPVLTVGAGANISGAALTLDSTYGTALDPTARITGTDIALNSGQISLQFEDAGAVPQIAGLMLAGSALQGLQSSRSLSLLSYSSIDLYGTGTFTAGGSLALNAGEIRGFNNGGGTVTFAASSITLGNLAGGTGPGASGALSGGLAFDAGTIRLGAGQVSLDQFATVDLQATGGLLTTATGALTTQGALNFTVPVVTAARAVNYSITSAGVLNLLGSAGGTRRTASGGLGATLSFTGASLTANTDIILPSGSLTLRATTGDLLIGNLAPTRLSAGGTAQTFHDLIRYTDGGKITLVADAGSVTLGEQSQVSVAAESGGGSAGSLSISAGNGTFALLGTLNGRGGAGGTSGLFSLDVNSLPSVTPVDTILNDASFTEARIFRVRSGNVLVDGLANAHSYRLSADQGSITVTSDGLIDASGKTGGEISLAAFGNVTLQSGGRLTVAAEDFNAAGKGGAMSLEAGSQRTGIVGTGFVDLQTGSTIDLSVASILGDTAAETAANTAAAALLGQFTGTLHLRAPQIGATDLQVNPLNGTILNASHIFVEGYQLFDLTGTGMITSAVQTSIGNNGTIFGSNIDAITARLLAGNSGLADTLIVAPGAEVINRTGNLTLGATNSTASSDWDLSTYRVGPKLAPGVLTLRAAGNLVFFNTLSDGFTSSANTAELLAYNPLLPANAQSWSYRLASGADLNAVDYHRVQSLPTLATNSGSLQLGKLVTTNNGNPVATGGTNAQTSAALAGRYQVIRTGSGNIDIAAGRDVQLLNQFATVYTAGARLADPTLGGAFQVPPSVSIGNQGTLGAVQQNPTYAAQYSLGGGNVTISAQQDIKHQTQLGGVLVADSQKQIPNNWLYRRGYVDPLTGEFGVTRDGDIGSTTWWIDFSNFFQGIGALGGGNVTLSAGRDVSNVDAVAPTNARMTFQTPTGDRFAGNQALVELGGGNVTVRAGHNIDAGIYYVERGRGTLNAGNRITTNSTRSASLGTLHTPVTIDPSPAQWLPTTLFLGKGGFDVSAGGDLLLGPVVNPFLLPGGLNNSFWRKSYFSTYAPTSEVNVTSLGGSITLRESSTRPGLADATPILQNWMEAVHVLSSNPRSVSFQQPWLRLDETIVSPFATVFTLLPGTLRATAFSSDINLVGTFNLSPSAVGTIELAAGGAINGLQVNGITSQGTGGLPQAIWGSATINLSDADPTAIPGVNSPFAYQVRAGTTVSNANRTAQDFLSFIDDLFDETGSSIGDSAVIQTKQALHGTSLLHAEDSEPVRLYASSGNISGLTLFSSKAAQIVAGGDISDIAFYIQNTKPGDISVVSSGRDIIAYNANSPLRVAAQAPGNLVNFGELPLAGDLQISGPGTLEVLAGRNLDLGSGANNPDGTGVGLTSIGNARNPNLPSIGADIVAGAGIGPVSGLAAGSLDFDAFITEVIEGPEGERYLQELAESKIDLTTDLDRSTFGKLGPELRAKLALEIFYLVLRDAGRDRNVPGSPGFGNYDAGFAAIATLFGNAKTTGDITTRSRDIRTRSGGSISLLAPGGGLTLATSIIGTPLTPPGILTEAGGNISIFAEGNVDIGVSRIFTLRGGNQIIWSSAGDIAAGSASKTVASAPPTRVLIDPQTASVQTDLAGLATGGGIGVLATVAGVTPGSVDLIAPGGTVDAGDAGIRASGDLNIAAVQVLNADNIQATGASAGVPTTATVAAPNLAGLSSASNAAGAASSAAAETANAQQRQAEEPQEQPSIITVEVMGYGGGEAAESAPESSTNASLEDEEMRRKRQQ